MSKRLILLRLVALAGCMAGNGGARSSGSLAVSSDQNFLYAADTDSNTLFVLDAKTLDQVAAVKVGTSPFRVVVGSDGAVYVANRGSRSVSVVHAGDWAVTGSIATGIDPTGMQVWMTARRCTSSPRPRTTPPTTARCRRSTPPRCRTSGCCRSARSRAASPSSPATGGHLALQRGRPPDGRPPTPAVIQSSTDIYPQANQWRSPRPARASTPPRRLEPRPSTRAP